MKNYKIISIGIEDCHRLISMISLDEKTNYIEPDCFEIGTDFQVNHIVQTSHNNLNLKRKYNFYQIEQL